MNLTKRLHWYCLIFNGVSLEEGQQCTTSTYTGCSIKDQFTLAAIKKQKAFAKIREDSVLTSITYLGFMTKEQFTAE